MTPPDWPAGSCGSHEPVPPQGVKDIFQLFLCWYYRAWYQHVIIFKHKWNYQEELFLESGSALRPRPDISCKLSSREAEFVAVTSHCFTVISWKSCVLYIGTQSEQHTYLHMSGAGAPAGIKDVFFNYFYNIIIWQISSCPKEFVSWITYGYQWNYRKELFLESNSELRPRSDIICRFKNRKM